MRIVLTGVNHTTAPLEVRERFAFTPERALETAAQLRQRGVLSEAVVVSTCNRSEVYGVAPDGGGDSASRAAAMLSHLTGLPESPGGELASCFYHLADREAVRHLFRVASGLDSMLLGEAEILGQVREAYRVAFEGHTTGKVTNRLFQSALEVGKRVRSQTEIGSRPMSVAFAAVKLAERIFGDLRAHSALIAGAGKVGEQAVDHLRRRGIRRILVTNRSPERAAQLARRMGGEAVAWEALAGMLEAPDIVLTSMGGAPQVITAEAVERAMAARRNRALFLIDLGVPRNVEPRAGELYNVYLYNVDDLAEIVEQNKQARRGEIPRAEAIIEEHVARFEEWHLNALAIELLAQLRETLEHEREHFLRRRLGALEHLSPEDRVRAERLIERLTREVLEEVVRLPEERLRRGSGGEMELMRTLVGLVRERS